MAALAVLVTPVTAAAAPHYSIDFQGPTALAPALGGPGAVTSGDILTPIPPGLLPPPAVAIPDVALGLAPSSLTGSVELDALSFGDDLRVRQADNLVTTYLFSVDEFATGAPGIGPTSVTTEGALGKMEASADIFSSVTGAPPLISPPPPPAALPPLYPAFPNFQVFDGNGSSAPGLNLVEPNPPTIGVLPDQGDNLDAFNRTPPPPGTPTGPAPVYFSLDARFADPLEGFPANSGTAAANGFVGGDVLVSLPGVAGPAIYAPAATLALDGTSGQDQDIDDLDALILWENNIPGYQPPIGPYSWFGGAAGTVPTDMLLFSVRRGSAIIGTPDFFNGVPIEEGDILMTPSGAPVPGIWLPAEALGLATVRSGTADNYGDDLDALDHVPEPSSLALVSLIAVTLAGARRRR